MCKGKHYIDMAQYIKELSPLQKKEKPKSLFVLNYKRPFDTCLEKQQNKEGIELYPIYCVL